MTPTIITAPEIDLSISHYKAKCKIFLAGGITNCPNWQNEILDYYRNIFWKQDYINNDKKTFIKEHVIFFNPRRENFPINDETAMEKQIVWEYNNLKNSDIIFFWFAKGSLNPIVLYELGRWGNSSNKPIVIGIDPEYERKNDVIIQTSLSRPDVVIAENFDEFIFNTKMCILEFYNKLQR